MPIYVMFTNLTEEGRKSIKEQPSRIREVNEEVEAIGVKILHQYALHGPYDFINVIEAPSHEAVCKVAIELGARGTIQTITMAALPLDAYIEANLWT